MRFFEINHKEKQTNARAGILHTAHGDIETPVFMPVGTQATVKSLDPRDLREIGARIVLGNTYHLHLRPGEDVIAKLGGLHKFMGWSSPILTDSGGFQVFSLRSDFGNQTSDFDNRTSAIRLQTSESRRPKSEVRKPNAKLVTIDDSGVTFRSHIDGSEHRFTPEKATETQHKLGADIIMAFDECTPDDVSIEYAREAMERTHCWAERCIAYHKNKKTKKQKNKTTLQLYNSTTSTTTQYLFGIVQGAKFEDLRKESARFISSLPFDGIAIGGESIGYNMKATKEILEWIIPLIPEDKPRYTMGVGFSPLDIFAVVERGVDMFDCVAPTRMARNGTLYTKNNPSPARGGRVRGYKLNITNARYRTDPSPIDPTCDCSTCAQFSRAYLHHLFNANELLAYRLSTIHNVRFFLKLMEDIRNAIQKDRLTELKVKWM